MGLPRGFGSVHKLPGKRRKPWRARKTIGWDVDCEAGKAKQLYITIGYFATKKEAMEALTKYNENPYDINVHHITFKEVYEKWSERHFETIVPSACRTWKSAFTHSKPLHDMRMRDIRTSHLEGAINDADVGQSTKQRMKSLYNQMFKYALKHEIVDKDYAALCDSVKRGKPQIVRIPFSDQEIQTLWNSLNIPFVDMILIGIYSGWRPQELATLKISDINLDTCTFAGGLKTDAGRNRTVPIHSVILPLVRARMDQAQSFGSNYLFNDPSDETHMTYDKYRGRWNKAMARLKMEHRPHDTRHTFITLGKAAKMDEYILKLIVGHTIRDITESIYTHRDIDCLRTEIEKITVSE